MPTTPAPRDKAIALFDTFNCAQSVFAAAAPAGAISEELCLVLAGPFGGGLGRTGETCGAVTGALLALGLRHGQQMATDPAQARGPLYQRVADFTHAFRQRHGALTCRELTGCDLRSPEGQARFQSCNLHHTLCRDLVASAVELLDQQPG